MENKEQELVSLTPFEKAGIAVRERAEKLEVKTAEDLVEAN